MPLLICKKLREQLLFRILCNGCFHILWFDACCIMLRMIDRVSAQSEDWSLFIMIQCTQSIVFHISAIGERIKVLLKRLTKLLLIMRGKRSNRSSEPKVFWEKAVLTTCIGSSFYGVILKIASLLRNNSAWLFPMPKSLKNTSKSLILHINTSKSQRNTFRQLPLKN